LTPMLKILATAALAIAPVLVTAPPPAHAEVCADAAGASYLVGGCADIGRDVVGGAAIAGAVAIAGATDPYWPGEIPCYSARACRTTRLTATRADRQRLAPGPQRLVEVPTRLPVRLVVSR